MRPALEAWRRPVTTRPEVRAALGAGIPVVAAEGTVWLGDDGERRILLADGTHAPWPPTPHARRPR